MDIAYDHIQEESLPQEPKKSSDQAAETQGGPSEKPIQTLNSEIAEAYKSISTTPWGAKLGGFFSTVQKQSSTLYDGARQEATAASGEAFKGFQDLRASLTSRARSMSSADKPPTEELKEGMNKEAAESSQPKTTAETEGMVSRFRSEAAKRLKDLEKAEEAADAAILRFGSNLGNFLKDAVTVTAPSEESSDNAKGKSLFESKGEDGKRVIHSTRLEAQLHAIHTSSEKFLQDPDLEGKGEGKDEWEKWTSAFDAESRTEDIKRDLEKYEELRKMMEKLVPEKVEYKDFWRRYYFLRDLVEKEEQRRREVLQGAVTQDSSIPSWDDDSEDEGQEDQSATPSQRPSTSAGATQVTKSAPGNASPASLTTIHPSSNLKPDEGRKSQDEKSQAGSDASYDLVSGATSKTPGSPKGKADDEEEDWE